MQVGASIYLVRGRAIRTTSLFTRCSAVQMPPDHCGDDLFGEETAAGMRVRRRERRSFVLAPSQWVWLCGVLPGRGSARPNLSCRGSMASIERMSPRQIGSGKRASVRIME